MSFTLDPTTVTPYRAAEIGGDASFSAGNLDLATLVLLISLERHGHLEKGVIEQMNDVQSKNNTLAEYRDILNKLKNLNLEDKKGEKNIVNDDPARLKIAAEVGNFFNKHPELKNSKLSFDVYTDVNGKPLYVRIKIEEDGAVDKTQNTLQTAIDKLSGNSQLEMIKLQSSMTKANEMMDFASNFVHKADEVVKDIVRNL